MERSDFEDEEVSASQCNKQTRTLTLEEKSVSLRSEDDQKLMRDNNLPGNPGKNTEELLRRKFI